jgi:carboxyl-terminal processing protease
VYAASTAERSQTADISKLEVRQVAALLERYHYNRGSLKPGDHAQIIPDFMADLDGQRLFFLNSDKVDFEKRFGSSLYYNLRDVGSIDTAYDIFALYEKRVKDRIAWVFEELKKDIDLNSREFHRLDRSKSDWSETAAAADELWRRRIKFEVGTEILNKKTPEAAKAEVRKRYERMLRNVADIEPNDIAEIFLTSFAHLYDPHSNYWNADSLEDFAIQMKLQLIGIGAVLGVEDDICVVKEIMPGSPADLDHRLKPNDKILAVAQANGETVDIIGMKLRRIVDQIRGKKGTQVKLIIQPADDTTGSIRKEIVLTRDVVEINSARAHGAVFDVPNVDGSTAPIGVITLPSFYGGDTDSETGERTSCAKDVADLVKRLKDAKVQGIVLDLRRNGGGLLGEAIRIAGLFIDSGPVVQARNFDGQIMINNDDDSSVAYTGPMAVLVDHFSASASEIVAGALQNYGRAIIVGDSSTHGKGTVQHVIEMKEIMPGMFNANFKTGGTKLTIQKFYLPNGSSTQRKGVIPDIVLPSWEDFIPMIGEADLPRALAWDEVSRSFFDGQPLSPNVLLPLRESSLQRQKQLEEFSFLNKRIDWLKSRFEQRLVSVNLDDRRKQKENDDAFDKEFKAERKRLEKSNFAFHEVRLVPPPPPRKKAPPKEGEEIDEDDDIDENDTYTRLDVQLRESLRIVVDSIKLGHDHQRWNREYAPLTLESVRNGQK